MYLNPNNENKEVVRQWYDAAWDHGRCCLYKQWPLPVKVYLICQMLMDEVMYSTFLFTLCSVTFMDVKYPSLMHHLIFPVKTHRYVVKWRISLRFNIGKHLDNVRTQVNKIYYKGLVTVRHLNVETLHIISLYWHTNTSNCVADWDICQYRCRFSEYCICREAASISFT